MKVRITPRMDRNNGWLEILPKPPSAVLARGNIRTDYAIVGAGFTGLAAARRLAELYPQAAIALIEAGRIGNNAAGRCSGFAIDQAHNIRTSSFADVVEVEKQQIALNRSGQDYLRTTVRKHAIECDWDESGKVHAAATAKGQATLRAYAKHLGSLDVPHTWMDARELRQLTGSGFYILRIHTPGTILVQPAALVLGLARSLPSNVAVYEDSPISEVVHGSPHQLITDDARITAQTVLLSNNGFAGQFGYYDRHLVPIVTWASLSRPMTNEEQDRLGGSPSWGIIPANPFGSTVRRTVEDRILIRNTYSFNSGLNPSEPDRLRVQRKHQNSLRNRFPMLPDLDFEYTWGGPLSLSRNGEPVFGALGQNVFGAFCLNGVGISRGTAYGKLLAELIFGKESALLTIMLGAGRPCRLPPPPILGLGARLDLARRRFGAGREL